MFGPTWHHTISVKTLENTEKSNSVNGW